MSSILKGFVVPGVPHILLAADRNPGWQKVRKAFDQVQKEIEALSPDVLVLYSTYWPSIIGHQIQAYPEPEWVHVDELFHDLGSIPYKFKMDPDMAEAYREQGQKRGLHMRTTSYYGFPIDTGSVVALKLLNPHNKIPAIIVSSNIYADRAETIILGKAVQEALKEQNKTAVALAITSLSNRLLPEETDPKDDHIFSQKDQEWNLKYLEFLGEGRLEDASQLSRQFHNEARVHKVSNFKPLWWLSAAMGSTNNYEGQIYEYQPIMGTGAALIGLTPSSEKAKDLEFDEDNPEVYEGERHVLGQSPFAPPSMGDNPHDN